MPETTGTEVPQTHGAEVPQSTNAEALQIHEPGVPSSRENPGYREHHHSRYVTNTVEEERHEIRRLGGKI